MCNLELHFYNGTLLNYGKFSIKESHCLYCYRIAVPSELYRGVTYRPTYLVVSN